MASATYVKEATTGRHVGYGKVILFGEHFVVYGAPAIVAGVSEYTDCALRVTRGVPGVRVDDRRPAVPGYIAEKRAEQANAHALVLQHLRVDTRTDGLLVHLGGPLAPTSGIGASASDVVALSRALSELCGLQLSDAQVNESAFVGEGGYHGTPSGVDNTAATYGGLLSFRRRPGTPAQFARLPLPCALHLVVVGTGITASTTAVVRDVRALRTSNGVFFRHLLAQYTTLAYKAEAALRNGDLERVGRYMDINHGLCHQLGISCREVDAIVGSCRSLGALGAKVSGTGRGGIVVALAESADAQARLAAALRATCAEAKFVWQYTVGTDATTMTQQQHDNTTSSSAATTTAAAAKL